MQLEKEGIFMEDTARLAGRMGMKTLRGCEGGVEWWWCWWRWRFDQLH